ncbi:MAG: ABC transporter ATP-binding protein [Clostridiales bacterium]|jgi:putative ABC transport system ATP-binding protein|nr:ABC transporter ATP-binding protein [Clostridiales bacterium]
MIKAKNVSKRFTIGQQKLQVLKDVSLTVEAGEFVSLMGPSGSGKSTLLYILGGLDKADAGSISINGKKIGNLSDSDESAMRRDDIGFVFQAYNLIDNLTVEENILIPALLDGKKRSAVNERLEELLKAVGLFEHRTHRPMELSGGQQQRTAIARALINRPKVVFADEPIGNLDSQNGKEVLELLSKLNKQYGITILMVTHFEESTRYGDRVIRLRDGKLV